VDSWIPGFLLRALAAGALASASASADDEQQRHTHAQRATDNNTDTPGPFFKVKVVEPETTNGKSKILKVQYLVDKKTNVVRIDLGKQQDRASSSRQRQTKTRAKSGRNQQRRYQRAEN